MKVKVFRVVKRGNRLYHYFGQRTKKRGGGGDISLDQSTKKQ